MQLIISEKPSVGAAIATALDARDRKNECIEGNGLVVSWCVGHPVGLADAGSCDERFEKWHYDGLPIPSDKWQYVLSPGKKEQFTVLKNLMGRSGISGIINACDVGRGGELIFRLVYEMAGCIKPTSRPWISSMEDTAVREGLGSPKPSIKYGTLYQSALCYSKAGWLIGINTTRIFSVPYHKALDVGRVQTPIPTILVERDGEISGFQKEKYYLVRIELDGLKASGEQISNLQEAQKIQTVCHERRAICVPLDKEKKTVKPPKLFGLITLQREVNHTYGYTAKQTLDYAQSLYERKLITYPRTNSQYLISDTADTAADVLELMTGFPLFAGYPNFSPNAAVLISDKDISDHRAIIPTMEAGETNLTASPIGECSLFFLICCKLLCGTTSPHVYEVVTAVFECGGYRFTANEKRVLIEGWETSERLFRASLKEKPEDDTRDESDLPELARGKILECVTVFIAEHYTTPSKLCTKDTLPPTMEHADKGDIPEDAERKGLGTPATRAAIIEKLVPSGFAEYKGRSLMPTEDGISLTAVLPKILTSPLLTVEWEKGLSEIARSAADQRAFMEDIQKMAAELVNFYPYISEDRQKLFAPQGEPVGLYPRCREQVYEGKRNFYCENRGCDFILWENDRFWLFRRKELIKKMAAGLLEKGRVEVKGVYSEKKGTTYDATVTLDDTGGKYINFKLGFEERRERASER